MKTIILLLPILIFNCLHSSEFDLIDEQYTLSYQAAQIKATNSSEDIPVLVRDSVSVVYQAYKPQFDQAKREAAAEISRRNMRGGTAVEFLMTKAVYPFIEVIINEIDKVAQKLTPEDRQQFWVHAEGEVTRVMESYSYPEKGSIAFRVRNLVNMKKVIG